ncbi:alpha/beta hydrolase, partial [Acinetobacter bereziniae]
YILATKKDFSFKNKILHGQMFISDHDQYVPKELSLTLAQELNFAYTVIPNAGHFLASDGYIEFPQLLDWLRNATEAHD